MAAGGTQEARLALTHNAAVLAKGANAVILAWFHEARVYVGRMDEQAINQRRMGDTWHVTGRFS